ncbi:MAG: ATP-dependent RNA helicase [Spirochaetales bacterium]|nr:ATP-dependent RNA helicase [Spirochaetales bacterium]
MKQQNLPVYKQRNKILKKLKTSQVIVVESPTGSGKTTQIPQILLKQGYAKKGIIGITQPRRIAAVSVADFMAKQLNSKLPEIVGYKMRFEDITGPTTKVKVMTDGILLQEMKADDTLSRYSVIIVDEAHERSLNIDFILGLLKRTLRIRKDFKVIVSSATINTKVFSGYFDNCPIVSIDSRVYPVEEIFDPPEKENDIDSIFEKINRIITSLYKKDIKGDILVFLSGSRDINNCIQMLKTHPENKKMELLPLYSMLSQEEQERVFLEYPGKRKVIVATNIAETSVTIDGITIVVDSGLAKMNFYNPRTFTESLIQVPISRAACDQRRGRAGRTRPGICYRLYSKSDYANRLEYTQEEIYRTDLSEVVLRMAELGIKDYDNFDFLSSPGKPAIASAIETLKMLDALDAGRELTKTGKMMVPFPMLPKHSRIIVEAILKYPEVLEEVCIACSFLTTHSPFLLPPGEEIEARRAHHTFRDRMGDFVSYLRLYDAFIDSKNREKFCERYYLEMKTLLEIVNIKEQLEDIITEMKIPLQSGGDLVDYLCSISKGLIQFVCCRTRKGMYKSLTADQIYIHPGSVMYQKTPRYIVAGEIVKTSRIYARSVSELDKNWLTRISPLLKSLSFDRHKKQEKENNVPPVNQKRDFNTQIRIGDMIFPVKREKNKKKVVILAWEKLKALMKTLDKGMLTDYKGLRGKILYERLEILPGASLNTILRIADKIEPDKGILYHWPKGNFTLDSKQTKLFNFLDKILYVCRRHKNTKKTGFLSLCSDGEGTYWYRCAKSFDTALSESLASLEVLADEPEEYIGKAELSDVNRVYHKLSQIILE